MIIGVQNTDAFAGSAVMVAQRQGIVEAVLTPHTMPLNIRVMPQQQRPTIVSLGLVHLLVLTF